MARGEASVLPGGAASLRDLLASGQRSFSFEFFPPKTDEGEQALWHAFHELEALRPTFVSVTYGAGGSNRDRTVGITGRIERETSLTAVAHLTCVGSSVDELRGVVGQYADAGIRNVLALRGDPAGGLGTPWVHHPEGLDRAVELVALVRSLGDFAVGVAAFPEGHPESPSLEQDAAVLRAKQDAGADFAVTQMFFEADDYFRLLDRAAAAGATMPIVPGLMPVTNVAQIERMAALQGSEIPAALGARFDAVRDDPEAVRALGIDVATAQAEELLAGGAPGLHFFTLNRSTATREVYTRLGVAAEA